MPTAARPRPSRAAFDLLMTPARWLEQARGRRRGVLLASYLLLGGIAGVFGRRAVSLNGLPDVGDPFDVRAEVAIDVPEAENAFVLYGQAAAKLKELNAEDWRRFAMISTWSQSDPAYRRWVETNREASDLIRRGSERPKGLYHRPGESTFETPLEVTQRLRQFARLAPMEASRLEEAGDLAGAWAWHRALLRASRHVGGHGTSIQALIGIAMLRVASGPASTWAADPRVGAPLLRRALRDVMDCEAMSPRASDALRVEYLCMMKAIDAPGPLLRYELAGDPVWYHHLTGLMRAGLYLKREPERSRRVTRLAFANWLAQCDRPPNGRARLAMRAPDVYLYDADPAAPAAANALPPGTAGEWMKSTELAARFGPMYFWVVAAFDRDRRTLAALKVTLAEQLYRREHGRPPGTLGALVSPDLPALPDGYEAGDPPISTGATTPAP